MARKFDRKLIMDDGSEYPGYAFGGDSERVLEVVFNTSMVGYQEILTDPSYTYQAVVMTYPLIGNYGVNDGDNETFVPSIGGLIVGEVNMHPSNFRCTEKLSDKMKEYGIPGLEGADTRKLTRSIRDFGSRKGIITDISVTAEQGIAKINAQPLRRRDPEALEAFRARYPQLKPVACAGLSLGEYGALYAAGAFSFADGLRLLSKRAELMDSACRATAGGMASVLGGDLEVIRRVCGECGIDVANYNSPGQIVISGEKSLVEAAVAKLKEAGMRKVIVLNVAGAFHSRLMAQAGEELRPVLASAPVAMPSVPVYQNYSASPARDAAEIRENLASQVAGSVRWEECVRGMVAAGGDTMIEFGPGNVLTGLLRRTLPEIAFANINSVETLNNFAI